LSKTVPKKRRVEEEVEAETGLTKEVVERVKRIARNGMVMAIITGLVDDQARLEKRLADERASEVDKLEKRKNDLFAREIIGEVTSQDTKNFELQTVRKLQALDKDIVSKLDAEMAKQQGELAKLGVPLFHVTMDVDAIKLQMQVLKELLKLTLE